jgi:hypothetical protein
MGGDFHDFEADYFLMNDNRISAILNGTFKNFGVISSLGGNLSELTIPTPEGVNDGRLQGFQYSSSVPVLL